MPRLDDYKHHPLFIHKGLEPRASDLPLHELSRAPLPQWPPPLLPDRKYVQPIENHVHGNPSKLSAIATHYFQQFRAIESTLVAIFCGQLRFSAAEIDAFVGTHSFRFQCKEIPCKSRSPLKSITGQLATAASGFRDTYRQPGVPILLKFAQTQRVRRSRC